MSFIQSFIQQLESYATQVSVELFVFLGSFIEEVIAPIPSPFVMTLAGSIAQAQNRALLYLTVLAVLGATGKTLGAWVLYFIADKAEDVIVGKYGRFFGVSHKEIEAIGKHLNKGWQDHFFLFVARALPIIPSAPVSVVCGLIKLDIKTYLSSTFFGTCVRNMLYLYVGYIGISSYEQMMGGIDSMETMVQITIGISIIGIIIWAYYKRRKISKDH